MIDSFTTLRNIRALDGKLEHLTKNRFEALKIYGACKEKLVELEKALFEKMDNGLNLDPVQFHETKQLEESYVFYKRRAKQFFDIHNSYIIEVEGISRQLLAARYSLGDK